MNLGIFMNIYLKVKRFIKNERLYKTITKLKEKRKVGIFKNRYKAKNRMQKREN